MHIAISIAIYIRVFMELRHRVKHRMTLKNVSDGVRKVALSSETRRTTKMMAFVLGSIVLCWLPFTAVSTISTFIPDEKHTISLKTVFLITLLILYANSFLNPLIYAWRSPLFRKAYATLLSCGRLELKAKISQDSSSD